MTKTTDPAAERAAEEEKREAERLRAEIDAKIKRVPPSVVSGSYDLSVRYKAAAIRAQSVSRSPRAKLAALRNCATELARFA